MSVAEVVHARCEGCGALSSVIGSDWAETVCPGCKND